MRGLRGLIQHAFMKRNLESLAGPIREIAQETAAPLRGLPRLLEKASIFVLCLFDFVLLPLCVGPATPVTDVLR